eukprot:6468159-Amphidinium_carterae.8
MSLPEAMLDFKTLIRACACLCTSCAWDLHWLELEDSKRVVLKVSPMYVTAGQLRGCTDGQNLWPPERALRRRATRAAPILLGDGVATSAGALPPASPDTDVARDADQDLPDDDDNDDDQAEEENEEDIEEVCEVDPDLEDLLFRSEAMMELYQEPSVVEANVPKPLVPESMQTVPLAAESAPDMMEAEVVVAPPALDDAQPGAGKRRGRGTGQRGVVSKADCTYFCDGGRISYYTSKDCFEAFCDRSSHGTTCTLTRTRKGRMRQGVETSIAGRPLGLLLAWLQRGANCHCKEEHKCPSVLAGCTYEMRASARAEMMQSSVGRELSSYERGKHEEETDEPLELTANLKNTYCLHSKECSYVMQVHKTLCRSSVDHNNLPDLVVKALLSQLSLTMF